MTDAFLPILLKHVYNNLPYPDDSHKIEFSDGPAGPLHWGRQYSVTQWNSADSNLKAQYFWLIQPRPTGNDDIGPSVGKNFSVIIDEGFHDTGRIFP
jgi:hypothetical protein